MRMAPSYCFGTSADSAEHPYSSDTVANFLQWEQKTVSYTLRALCLIEQGHLKESQLKGLSHSASRTVIDETQRAVKQAEAIEKEAKRKAMAATPARAKQIEVKATEKAKAIVSGTANAVSSTLQKGEAAATARTNARAARVQVDPKAKELPEIDQAAKAVASGLRRYLDDESATATKIAELVKFKKHMSAEAKHELTVALDVLIEYAEGYRKQLG